MASVDEARGWTIPQRRLSLLMGTPHPGAAHAVSSGPLVGARAVAGDRVRVLAQLLLASPHRAVRAARAWADRYRVDSARVRAELEHCHAANGAPSLARSFTRPRPSGTTRGQATENRNPLSRSHSIIHLKPSNVDLK